MSLPGYPPALVARFRPRRALAAGAYGQVFEATQVALDRPVALKVLSAGMLDDAEQVARFQAEARVTAALAHPHIVVVIEHGVADGVPWIAYELLPGRTLRHAMGAGLAVEPALAQVAAALEHAHAAGVIHRDVKPDNVLEVAPGHYKVADFGVARWAGSGVRTDTGLILGTPLYIAPELVDGEAPSPASDLYALAVMAYELVEGRTPFTGDNPVKVMAAHLREPPPRMARAAPELESLVMRGLAKRPADRPSVAAFRAALERPRPSFVPELSTRPQSRPPTAVTRSGALRVRVRLALAMATLLGVLLSGALALRAPPPATVAPLAPDPDRPLLGRAELADVHQLMNEAAAMVADVDLSEGAALARRGVAKLRKMQAYLNRLPAPLEQRYAWSMAELSWLINRAGMAPSWNPLSAKDERALLLLLTDALVDLRPRLKHALDVPSYRAVRWAEVVGELCGKVPERLDRAATERFRAHVTAWDTLPRSYVTAAVAAVRWWAQGDNLRGAQHFHESLAAFAGRHFADSARPDNETVGAWYRLLKLVHERPTVLRGASAEERRFRESIVARALAWAVRCRAWAGVHETATPSCYECVRRTETEASLAKLEPAIWNARLAPWPHAPIR